MKRCTWTLALVLLATLSLGAQTLDLAAGAGSAANTGVPAGFWPAFSATQMFNQHLGVNTALSFDTGSLGYHPWMLGANLALRPAPRAVTPELLLGYAYVDLSGPGLIVGCAANTPGPARSCPQPQLNRSAFHIGGVMKINLRRHFFVQFGYHLYLGPQLNYAGGVYTDNVSRFALQLGYTFGPV